MNQAQIDQLTKLEKLVYAQQGQINKLKQALTACIDLCANQNKQLGMLRGRTNFDRLGNGYMETYADAIMENGELADKLLEEI